MQALTLRDQIVIYDREATVSAYKSIERGDGNDARAADAGASVNFAIRHTAQSSSHCWNASASIHSKSGKYIPVAKKPMNVSSKGGWFPFIGEWSPKSTGSTGKDIFSFPRQDELFYFTDSFPNATQKFGSKVLAIEFEIEVPKAADYISNRE
jgi:hypothetical protein